MLVYVRLSKIWLELCIFNLEFIIWFLHVPDASISLNVVIYLGAYHTVIRDF
jgi:hypothetical protein